MVYGTRNAGWFCDVCWADAATAFAGAARRLHARRRFSTSLATLYAGAAASENAARTEIKPLLAGLPHRSRFAYKPPEIAVDHLIVGGGAVGLAIASALAKRWPEKTTYLVERHTGVGMEISSRNSEVIHAGLYYPPSSFKTRLCLRGRELMYQQCSKRGLPYKQTGKLVVGDASSLHYFQELKKHCDTLPTSLDLYPDGLGHSVQLKRPPVRLISGDEARELEPDLSKDVAHALFSERTGIVGTHELLQDLHRELDEGDSAEVVLDTSVVRVDPMRKDSSSAGAPENGKRGKDKSNDGWVVQTVTGDPATAANNASDSILARVLINASGLNAPLVLNSLMLDGQGLRDESEANGGLVPMFYSKGNYASYKGPGVGNVKHLIYPTPFMGHESGQKSGSSGGKHSHQSLGTHLTLDLEDNVRFGPDTQWLSVPQDTISHEEAVDFWSAELAPLQEGDVRIAQMHRDITSYLPGISLEGLSPDYAGIRPKLVGPGGGFMDFTILYHASEGLQGQRLWQADEVPRAAQGGGLMLSLLGIESPGLTSSLAIAEYVRERLAADIWGDHNRSSAKSSWNEEVGGGKELDAWA